MGGDLGQELDLLHMTLEPADELGIWREADEPARFEKPSRHIARKPPLAEVG